MMKVDQFCRTAEDIARNYRTQYRLGGVGEHDGDLWYFDCVGLIKAIIWGWCGDTNYRRGGVVFPAQGETTNGLPDVGANKMFEDYCYDKSTDFTKIEVGELVWMDGHIGIYIGNRLVAEATSAWDNKVLLSDLGMQGQRSSNGRQVYSWTHHGKFKCVDYSKPTYKFNVGDMVVLNGYYHVSNDAGSQCIGETSNYIGTITKIKDGEYPYNVDLVWCREKYLSAYTGKDYEQLYKQELLKNKDLEKQVDNLQGKINKAMEDLK